jgi:myosin heavy subunit
MVNMEILNEAELLENLRERYKNDQFQTFVGPALLVINPFKKVDQIYGSDAIYFYS